MLTKEAKVLLQDTNKFGVVNVYAKDIVAAGELIGAGCVEAEDGTDGPWIFATEQGKRHLKD